MRTIHMNAKRPGQYAQSLTPLSAMKITCTSYGERGVNVTVSVWVEDQNQHNVPVSDGYSAEN